MTPIQIKWQRVVQHGTKKYGYVLVDNKNRPIQFNSDSGYFKVYDSPNTQSHYYSTYLLPKNKLSNNTVNDNNPVQLKEVQITAKKPTEFVGIQRTPDDHQAALARDRTVDAKVNPQNDQLQNFFANLMTGGMYSAVDQGTKNLAKGNYLEGAMQTATPIMFGPVESTVANLTRLGVGAYDLLSKNGVRKTLRLANNGDWAGAAKSAAGDALNLGMTLGGGYNLGKYNIPVAINYAARNGNNAARGYLISKELNQNVKNFDGTVGEEYFQQLPNGRWAIKGQILPNKNLYVNTPKATRYQFDSPTYQMYTGPQHDISEVINADGSINLRNLLNIQNEALKHIPGGTIARHRLENKKWHPTDWNTFLHTRDVYKRALQYNYPKEALFPTLMHDAGKLWSGDGHGPYGASIIQQIFPKASKEQIQAIYGHMEANPSAQLTRYVKGVDIKEPNQFRYVQH